MKQQFMKQRRRQKSWLKKEEKNSRSVPQYRGSRQAPSREERTDLSHVTVAASGVPTPVDCVLNGGSLRWLDRGFRTFEHQFFFFFLLLTVPMRAKMREEEGSLGLAEQRRTKQQQHLHR
ncbi:uncharacterized protein LOC129312491 [Prosopis cineraria]|uniref:uncharacterized protein LOC129312491 n=1 Tax=Prosopis cineraria TaxID=364024 RepID=UPI00240F54D4|nr:uncharacterized protein LOC129312491 [Prosopis cineraria]